MLISELSAMIHENAIAHGWWDEEPGEAEILALIHSKWSEALKEARAGRPMVWHACGEALEPDIACDALDESDCIMYDREQECKYREAKPQGIAVALIDGCLRILDYIGKLGIAEDTDKAIEGLCIDVFANHDKLPKLVCYLHSCTAAIMEMPTQAAQITLLLVTLSIALSWVKAQGLDPLALLMEKHTYNKTRPCKHGKRF